MSNFSFTSKDELSIFLKDKSLQKIFVICGNKSYKLSGAKNILDSLLVEKKTKYFFKKSTYTDLVELEEIIVELKKFSPDLIIGIGGGSVIDYAKVANVLINSVNLRNEISNSTYKINKKFTKLIAIPTTAGSGAEVTSNSVVYFNKIKYSVESDELKPDYFFLIPELVIGASNKIKSSAGFDAIAQAIESLMSKKSSEKSLVFAKKSLNISLEYYLDYLNKPNKENTSAMCIAANLSGEAINISKTIAPHAVSYPFTSIYNISHGHAVSLTLDKFLNFNYKNLEKSNSTFNLKNRYKIIFEATKTNNIESFDRHLKHLKKNANLECDFTKLGINIEENYSKIISGVNVLKLSNNPVKLENKDLREIIVNY